MCGSAGVSYETWFECFCGYSTSTTITEQMPPCPVLIKRILPLQGYTPQYNLWQLLFRSRKCLATDPRDKVFALRSLLSSQRAEMDYLINYTKSVEETFIEVALFLLPALGLHILTATRHPHTSNMPSWIPDWSQVHPLLYGFFHPDIMLQRSKLNLDMGDTSSILTSCDDHNFMQLHVKGVQYAHITHCSQEFFFDSLEDAQSQMKGLYSHMKNLRYIFDKSGERNGTIVAGFLGEELENGKLRFDRA